MRQSACAAANSAISRLDLSRATVVKASDECALFNQLETRTFVIVLGTVNLLEEHCQITIAQLAFMLAVLRNVDDREFPGLGVLGNTEDMIDIALKVPIDAGFTGIP